MTYKISLKKLKAVANPFEQVCFAEMSEPVKKFDVLNCISDGIVFPLEDSPFYYKVATSIAYEYLNFEPLNPIKIDLRNTANGWIVSQGIAHLGAAILKNEDFIYADIEGDEKIIKTLFGKPEVVDINPADKKILKWTVQDLSLTSSWENIDFIIKEIHRAPKQNLDQVLKMIPEYKWLETDFLKAVIPKMKDYDFSRFDSKILKSDNMFEAVKNNHILFSILWDNCYKNIYNKGNDDNNLASNTSLSSAEKELKVKIDKEVFSNKAMCMEFIDYSYSAGNLYTYFSLGNKIDKDIITKIFKKEENNSSHFYGFEKELPPEFFKEKENILIYLKRKYSPSEEFLKSNSYAYNSWINNKDMIVDILKDEKMKNISYFFNYLPNEFKKDKEILIPWLTRFPNTYEHLSHKLKNDPEIVQHFIKSEGDPSYLDNSLIFKMKDIDTIQKIISKNPTLLLEKDCPSEWKEDMDILLAVPAKSYNYSYPHFPKKIINLVLSTEENCLFMLEQTTDIYEHIPRNLKLSHAISAFYLQKLESGELIYKTDKVPKKLWGTKAFCLIAMQANHKLASEVPAQFFYEKDFIISFVKKIDNSLIEKEVFNYAPKEIKQLLDSFNVNSDYEEFLNKYMFNSQLNGELAEKNIDNKKKKI